MRNGTVTHKLSSLSVSLTHPKHRTSSPLSLTISCAPLRRHSRGVLYGDACAAPQQPSLAPPSGPHRIRQEEVGSGTTRRI